MKVALVCFGVLFAASHGGAFHPALDSLAVIRVPLGLVLLACCIWRLNRLTGMVALLTMVSFGLNQLFWDFGNDKSGDITLYQKNLGHWNLRHHGVLEDIAKHAPDVITFQEVSDTNRPILDALTEDYPHQTRCDFGEIYSMAVLSRLPPTGAGSVCSDERGLAAMEVTTPSGRGWIVSVHLHWPWPFEQPEQMEMVLGEMNALEGPIIVAGDFNQVPWSRAARVVSQTAGSPYQGPSAQTFQFKQVLRLPIDHIMAPRGSVSRYGYFDSDHRSLVARVGF